jgi:hypothetical protein
MYYAIIDMSTKRIARKNCADMLYPSERGAKGACTRMNKEASQPVARYIVMSVESFHRYLDPLVAVYNSITGDGKTPVMIPRSQEGSCCDQSTERYHSM